VDEVVKFFEVFPAEARITALLVITLPLLVILAVVAYRIVAPPEDNPYEWDPEDQRVTQEEKRSNQIKDNSQGAWAMGHVESGSYVRCKGYAAPRSYGVIKSVPKNPYNNFYEGYTPYGGSTSTGPR
jgi:hypothetical protein